MKKILKVALITIVSIMLIFTGLPHLKAAGATISVTSSTSKVVVGNTFSVNVGISGSSLGSWEYTISYDKSKLKLVSGDVSIADTFTESKTKTYKFKAIGNGSSKITVKSYGAYSMDEKKLSVTVNSKTISVITQKELEASYSKNNNLKSLSIDGLKLDPAFNKDKTEYKVEAPSSLEEVKINASAEDNKSTLMGHGIQKVSEGENKFNITVRAENGSTKTYTVIVNVKDPNPINVNINSDEYIVIKRESSLEAPEGYEKIKVKINEEDVPGLYNELNNYTLIGLKDKEGKTELYLYNKEQNNYKKYNEAIMNDVKLFPLDMDKSFETQKELATNILSIIDDKFNDNSLIHTKIKINGIEFDALKQTNNSEYAIIHARDLLIGKDNYYKYDTVINTVIRYDENDQNEINKKMNNYKNIILILGCETTLIIIALICVLIKQIKDNKKRRKLYEELQKQEEIKEEKIKKQNKKKKMIDDEEETKN